MSETTTATEAAAVEAEAPAPDATKPAKKRTAARKAPAAAKKKKAATKKKKAPAKKKAPVKKKKTDATQPASAGRGRPISSDKVHRMFLVLSRLCKEPGHSDGLTRPELRKDCGFEDLGTPQLQDKGYVTLSKHEGHRGVVVKATKEGRAIAKSEEKFAQSFTH